VKAIRKFNINAFPTTKVLIAGQSYKVMNVIFHNGSCIEEGHYKVCVEKKCLIVGLRLMIRKLRKNNGLEANDLYILFLQKVGNKQFGHIVHINNELKNFNKIKFD